MKQFLLPVILISSMIVLSCKNGSNQQVSSPEHPVISKADNDSIAPSKPPEMPSPGNIDPDSLVAFSKTLLGVPYLYASTDPSKGFDCSGFVTYVFNHFGMQVPRSSIDFTNYGRDITPELALPGDLILFTGTDSTEREVGHMGIIESIRNDTLHFIHSTSGKAKGVVITPMGDYYNRRCVKIIRVFPDSLFFQ